MSILNLTQHKLDNLAPHFDPSELLEEGVFDADDETRALIRRLLTFDELPSQREIVETAEQLAEIAEDLDVEAAMIGGPPWLMAELEAALVEAGVLPMYAFNWHDNERFSYEGLVVGGRFAARVHDAAHRKGGNRNGRLDRVRAAFPGADGRQR